MYTIANVGNGFVIKKNDQSISLDGVRLLLFKTYIEAEKYIVYLRQAKYNIAAGISE